MPEFFLLRKMADEKQTDENVLNDGGPEEKGGKGVKTKTVSSSNGGGSAGRSTDKRSAKEAAGDSNSQPAPAKVSKIAFPSGSQLIKKPAPISIKLGASKPKEAAPVLPVKIPAVAAVFNEDEDSEPEEMPPEAKMRMKNIGRDTPTSAGPNSFNKGKHGFSDHQKLWERKQKKQLDRTPDK
ncbi:PEST proteolytic signal-containing nuclear protein-like [Acipenser oxyrinchus oxyrinchus]|uniref:PEST proteolytic signal-containing nuclear protein n=1 Tax=Acipenser oxyrinchus oxyrinchus TaxID=40147 RepID=A0AAD8G932_ACIOX|nr:PEST proteolytic signal-containing nuclear protein-like [Acipenser oxyrinchus oxyrinchus]